jgi:hypothetical protein
MLKEHLHFKWKNEKQHENTGNYKNTIVEQIYQRERESNPVNTESHQTTKMSNKRTKGTKDLQRPGKKVNKMSLLINNFKCKWIKFPN